MKLTKIALFVGAATIGLVGCGGGGGGSTPTSSFEATAIDGKLVNAWVRADCDGNGEPELGPFATNESGVATVTGGALADCAIFVEANPDGSTYDAQKPSKKIAKLFLRTPKGQAVASPFSSLIALKMLANSSLDLDSAVAELITDLDGLGLTKEQILGDYTSGDTKNVKAGLAANALFVTLATTKEEFNAGVNNSANLIAKAKVIKNLVNNQIAKLENAGADLAELENWTIVVEFTNDGKVIISAEEVETPATDRPNKVEKPAPEAPTEVPVIVPTPTPIPSVEPTPTPAPGTGTGTGTDGGGGTGA
ncbi:hypothetical protein [Motilimonas cestriensis]|uniref:hypothetical protein n=1 Tax=Motilimonas cestriensis TaxID=2742685 RepID=UPI003DA35BF4